MESAYQISEEILVDRTYAHSFDEVIYMDWMATILFASDCNDPGRFVLT